jgi:hypothetical protein
MRMVVKVRHDLHARRREVVRQDVLNRALGGSL